MSANTETWVWFVFFCAAMVLNAASHHYFKKMAANAKEALAGWGRAATLSEELIMREQDYLDALKEIDPVEAQFVLRHVGTQILERLVKQ